jgi:hypothetical protein
MGKEHCTSIKQEKEVERRGIEVMHGTAVCDWSDMILQYGAREVQKSRTQAKHGVQQQSLPLCFMTWSEQQPQCCR